MRQVEKITVENNGNYVFNFSVQWQGRDGTWTTTDWNSGNFPLGQSRTTPPLQDIGVPDDAIAVTVYGHEVLGSSGQGTPFVGFAKNGQIATYKVYDTVITGLEIVLVQ